MLFIVRFTDDPSRLSVRQTFMSDHLAWLKENGSSVLVAGSLRTEVTANPIGACWVVEAESKDEVEKLLRTDPFWIHGLRERCEVLHWMKAFPERKVPV